jgi:tetratricopeptide (TPR) repeat protein
MVHRMMLLLGLCCFSFFPCFCVGAEEEPWQAEREHLRQQAKILHQEGVQLFQRQQHRLVVEKWEQALALFEKLHSAVHPDVALLNYKLGSVHRRLGNLRESATYLGLALTQYQKLFPRGNPDVADCYYSLGLTVDRQGQYPLAADYFRTALTLRQKFFPADHPQVLACYMGLSSALFNKGGSGWGRGSQSACAQSTPEAISARECGRCR